MKILKFKTNIKCSGCIANVKPFLNSNQNIKKWNVDMDNPEKTLTIESENISEKDVIALVEKAGYSIEPKN